MIPGFAFLFGAKANLRPGGLDPAHVYTADDLPKHATFMCTILLGGVPAMSYWMTPDGDVVPGPAWEDRPAWANERDHKAQTRTYRTAFG